MVPQNKGVVPPKIAARLELVAAIIEAADAERDAAILAALRAGGSYNEIARHVGMTNGGVHRVGQRYGWPDAATREARSAKRNAHEHEMWTIDFYREHGRLPTPDDL